MGPPAWAATADNSDQALPCTPEELTVSAAPPEAATGHRAVILTFSLSGTLADGAGPCTLTGYPGVDSGAGGPLIHAQRTLHGYMGGPPASITVPPTVTLTQSQQAQAIVEGLASDANGNPCPTYTDLLVTPPETTVTVTVPATIDTCQLQVHPITEVPAEPGQLPLA
jgi:hypothetical protein